ncbi:LytTR family DNA-binding domain-containing protein [Sphingomonas donggukensis]|uniref:LytTR family DNA-binding domain-containing protein n=1 Tax=Sphingomonas donggukensis TaxID=2949093 RepID=A0ABY4TR65_9SPHN|nr:LytTR family DNA-binding domain-containing protein [Sphingomonas donggukensis]URW74882.1 LytTR family DNA-binding domain-containing protein [Sphingomonas donggukensis]
MRVLIADDEPLARALLRALLTELPGVALVGEAGDGDEAVEMARALAPDVLFLDIDMPQRNGIHAAIELAATGIEIIFVTAHEEHAIDAFEIGALDYVLKPVRRPRLARTVERALLRHAARRADGDAPAPARDQVADAAIWVSVLRGNVRVAICDIVRVEAARDHVYLHTAQRAYLHRVTMVELERLLEGSGMIRVHRSAFLRPDRVAAVHRRGKALTLELVDGTSVPVGASYRAATLAAVALPPR